MSARIPTRWKQHVRTRRLALAGAAVFAPLAAVVSGAYGVQYQVIPLGDSYGIGYTSQGLAVNNSGQVTGVEDVADGGYHAFLYDGTMHDLGSLASTLSGAYYSEGYGINAAGQIAGYAQISSGADHAFRYDGTMHDLGVVNFNFSQAFAINASGGVVGYSGSGGSGWYNNGTMHALPNLPGGSGSAAFGINDSGKIVGSAGVSGNHNHAFMYDGTMHDLGTLGGLDSTAYAINNLGQIVGSSLTASGTPHLFLYDGTMHDLGNVGGPIGPHYSINDSGVIVGNSDFGGGPSAFYYDGTIHDLNTLLVSGSGWRITDAEGISDTGLIAATGTNPSLNYGRPEALLLQPLPEPSSFVLLSAALSALLVRRRRACTDS